MTVPLNTHAPVLIGDEWMPRRVSRPMTLDGGGYALTVYPNKTESWSTINVKVDNCPPGASFILDVYPGDEPPILPPPKVVTMTPSSIEENIGSVTNATGGTLTIADIQTYNSGAAAQFTGLGQSLHIQMQANGTFNNPIYRVEHDISLWGEHPGPMRLGYHIGDTSGTGLTQAKGPYIYAGGSSTPLPLTTLGWGERYILQQTPRPWTNKLAADWTPAAVGIPRWFAIITQALGNGAFVGPVFLGYWQVRFTCSSIPETGQGHDPRVSWGQAFPSQSGLVLSGIGESSLGTTDSVISFTLREPMSGVSSALAVSPGQPLTLVIRSEAAQAAGGYLSNVAYGGNTLGGDLATLDSNRESPLSHVAWDTTFHTGTGAVKSIIGTNTSQPYMVPQLVSVVASDSGQPYDAINAMPVCVGEWAKYTFNDFTQTGYTRLRTLIKYDELNPPTAPLTIDIYDTLNTGAGFSQTLTINVSDFATYGTLVGQGWWRLDIPITALNVTGTNAYAVRFSSFSDPDNAWNVAEYNSTNNSIDAASYIGAGTWFTTNQDGAVIGTMAVNLISPPMPVTGGSVTAQTQAVTTWCTPCITPACPVTGIPYNHITWTAPAVTGTDISFAEWQLERQDTEDTTWTRIHEIDPLSTCDGLRLAGDATGQASTPDNAALDIATNLDLRARWSFDEWPPFVNDSVKASILAKQSGLAQHSYGMMMLPTGRVSLETSATGAPDLVPDISTVSLPLIGTGKSLATRVTRLGNTDVQLNLSGTGATATTPDAAALDITGDIDLRWYGSMPDWATIGGSQATFVAKWQTTSTESYMFSGTPGDNVPSGRTASGTEVGTNLQLSWTTAGGPSGLFYQSSVAVPVIHDALVWLRATLDVNNGGGGYTVTFYWSHDGTNWNILGEPLITVSGTTSIFSGTSRLSVGDNLNFTTSAPYKGRVSRVQVYNGIGGTLVADPNFAAQPAGTTSFNDSTGKTWTINSPAAINVGRRTTFYYLQNPGLVSIDTNTTTDATWAQLGDPIIGASRSIFNSTAPLTMGGVTTGVTGVSGWKGCVQSARVFNTITGTGVVANPDFNLQAAGTSSFADAAGRTWTITAPAAIVDPLPTQSFDDYEARMCSGISTTYRVRLVTNLDVSSDWFNFTPIVGATPSANGIFFTSNENPLLNVAYPDVYSDVPTQDFAFLSAGQTALVPLYNQDFQVALRSPEERGVQFTRTVLVNALCIPTLCVNRGEAPFDPIRAISTADIPHVCVRDADGNRWMAAISVPSGTIRRKTMHMAAVTITQIST